MDRIDYDVALEIVSHEAIVPEAYKDSVGVWTWSVGITTASGHKVERYIGKPQPLDYCLAVFAWALERYADDVREAFRGHVLTKAQFAAALSFHYNTGAIKRASWVKHWKAGNVAEAKKAFMDWRKPAAIIPRRQKERDLFFKGKWSNDGRATVYTRVMAGGRIDWGSARRVDIRQALREALGLEAPQRPQERPEAVPAPSQPRRTERPPAAKPEPARGLPWVVWLTVALGLGAAAYFFFT